MPQGPGRISAAMERVLAEEKAHKAKYSKPTPSNMKSTAGGRARRFEKPTPPATEIHSYEHHHNTISANAAKRSTTPSRAVFRSKTARFPTPTLNNSTAPSAEQLLRNRRNSISNSTNNLATSKSMETAISLLSRDSSYVGSSGSLSTSQAGLNLSRTAFCSQTERFDASQSKAITDVHAYDVSHNTMADVERRRSTTPSRAAFRSRTQRFDWSVSDTPGPGAYRPEDATEALNTSMKNQNKKGPLSLHKGERFEKPSAGYTDVHAFEKDHHTINQENMSDKFRASPTRAVFRSRSKRFQEKEIEGPGPGAYTSSLLSAGLWVN